MFKSTATSPRDNELIYGRCRIFCMPTCLYACANTYFKLDDRNGRVRIYIWYKFVCKNMGTDAGRVSLWIYHSDISRWRYECNMNTNGDVEINGHMVTECICILCIYWLEDLWCQYSSYRMRYVYDISQIISGVYNLTGLVKTSTNRNVDNRNDDTPKPKRRQIKTWKDQNVDRVTRRQTRTNQTVDRPKRRQPKIATKQNVHTPY